MSLSQLRPAPAKHRPFRIGLAGFQEGGAERPQRLDRRFVAALLANVFFSTFPIR